MATPMELTIAIAIAIMLFAGQPMVRATRRKLAVFNWTPFDESVVAVVVVVGGGIVQLVSCSRSQGKYI